MKRLILTAAVLLGSTLTLWAQTEGSTPAQQTAIQAPSTSARHHRNKQRNHRHHPRHHTSINARR
jgi:hypothetical protein